MNDSLKAVTQALAFQKPDRLAVSENGFYQEWIENWRTEKNLPRDAMPDDYYGRDLSVHVANETFCPTEMQQLRQDGPYIIVDDGWCRHVKKRPGTYFSEVVDRRFKLPGDLEKIAFEPADLDIRYQGLNERIEKDRQKGMAVFVKTGGIFIRSSFFRGETEFLMDLAMDKSFAKAISKKVADHLLAIGLETLKRTNTYDTGVWIYDDMCNVSNPMFSPATFEEIFLPLYKDMIKKYKSAGVNKVILHCDGNLMPLIDMIIEAGFDGINPVERNAGLLVEKLVPKYHGKLAFIGGICNTQILPGNDMNEISRHVEAAVEAGKNGGLIIGTHSVGPDISVQAFDLYRSIIKEKGAYK